MAVEVQNVTETRWRPHDGPQAYALSVRNVDELLYGGARGGGKTDAGMAWLIKPSHMNNPNYRALIIRRNADDLSDWTERAKVMYRGSGATFTGKPATIRWSSGPIFKLGHLKDEEAYEKYQGHEYQKMLIEELTQIPSLDSYLKLISSCRSTLDGVSAQVFATTNPGGKGMMWVKERWGLGKKGAHKKHKPNLIYRIKGEDPDEDRSIMFVPSTVEDNPTLCRLDPKYLAFLNNLPEPLRSAWRYGDWDIFMGQMFSFGEKHIIKPLPVPEDALLYSTFDWGFGAPYAYQWWWVDADGRIYLFGEEYGAIPGQANKGLRQTDDEIAEIVIAREKELGIWGRHITRLAGHDSWNKKPDLRGGGQGPSTATVFAQHGLGLTKADPSRILKIRQFHMRLRVVANARGEMTELPMMVVYDTCANFIRTVPLLQSDPKNPEFIDRKDDAEVHSYDAAAQIVMARQIGEGSHNATLMELAAQAGV